MIELSAMGQALSRQIIKSTFSNIAGKLCAVIIALFLTPYTIRMLGLERYGLFAIAGVVANYIGLLDFGVGSSFVKYIAQFRATKDYRSLNQVLNTGFAYYAVFSALVCVLAVPLLGPIIAFLKIPPFLAAEARFVLIAGLILFCGSNMLGVFLAVPSGLLRMDVSNAIVIAGSLLNAASTVFFLERGWGLRGLAVSNLLVFFATACVNVIAAYKLLPGLRFNPFAWDAQMFRRSFSFGWQVQVTRISGTVTTQTDKLLITYFLALGMVTFYQLASGVVYYATIIPGLLVTALVPAFSHMEAIGQRRKLIEAYLQSTKYLTFFTAPLLVFVAVSAWRIMRIWMGAGYGASALLIQILVAAFAVNAIARVASALSMAMEESRYMVRGSIITIAVNIPVSIILIKAVGFSGVAWGTLIAVNLGTFYFLVKLHRRIGLSLRKYAKALVPCFFVSLVAGACAVLFDTVLHGALHGPGRLQEMILLILDGVFFGIIYLAGILRVSFFTRDDWLFLKEKFPGLYGFMRAVLPGVFRRYAL